MEDARQLLGADGVSGPAEEGAVVQGRHGCVGDDAVAAQGGEASLGKRKRLSEGKGIMGEELNE